MNQNEIFYETIMKIIIINFVTILFFTFSVFAQSVETGILYLWELSSGKVWKNFGDEKTQHVYKGEIKNQKPHGLGIMLFPDGTKYMGLWKSGKRHGQGTLTLSDGEKISGEWKENKEWIITKYDSNGKIIAKYLDGEELVDFKKEGILFYRIESGIAGWFSSGDNNSDYKYVGEIENQQPNGWGKLTYPSGDKYEGEYKDGKAHGQGTFNFADGRKGVGAFRENKPWNVTEYNHEGKIIGRYTEGVRTVFFKKVGVLFTHKEKGNWVWYVSDEKRDEGGRYVGEIEKSRPDGRGTLTYRNGTKYVGEFKAGEWNGQGNFYFPDGEKWVGEFRKDEPWNITWYDNQGNIIAKWGNGVKIK